MEVPCTPLSQPVLISLSLHIPPLVAKSFSACGQKSWGQEQVSWLHHSCCGHQRAVGTHTSSTASVCFPPRNTAPAGLLCLLICRHLYANSQVSAGDHRLIFSYFDPLFLNLYPFQIWKRDMELLYMTYLNPNTFY